ncbi:hypothetical protein AB6N23_02510 [Cellulomonas sp. 179-A 9B4 NHS]|uniref:hypothetical protein n=1 Tax=Cellulomonas sp. 179-A 9B4 NHS TaxID=3142379 RepID=UPI0039A2642C
MPALVASAGHLHRARELLRRERLADSRVRDELLQQAGSAVLAVAKHLADRFRAERDEADAERWALVRADPQVRELAALLLDEDLAVLLDHLGHEPPPTAERLSARLQHALASALLDEDEVPGTTMRALRESLDLFVARLEQDTEELADALPHEARSARRRLRASIRTGARALLPLLVSAAAGAVVAVVAPPAGAVAGVVAGYAGAEKLATAAFDLAGGRLATTLLAPVTGEADVEQVRRARLAEIARNARAVRVLAADVRAGVHDPELAVALVSSLRISVHLYLATEPMTVAGRGAVTMLELLAAVTDPDDRSVRVEQLPYYAEVISGLADVFETAAAQERGTGRRG